MRCGREDSIFSAGFDFVGDFVALTLTLGVDLRLLRRVGVELSLEALLGDCKRRFLLK